MFRSSFFIFFLPPLLLGEELHEYKPLTIQGTVNSENEQEFSINVSSKRPLRIVAEVIGSSKEAPVLFSFSLSGAKFGLGSRSIPAHQSVCVIFESSRGVHDPHDFKK